MFELLRLQAPAPKLRELRTLAAGSAPLEFKRFGSSRALGFRFRFQVWVSGFGSGFRAQVRGLRLRGLEFRLSAICQIKSLSPFGGCYRNCV